MHNAQYIYIYIAQGAKVHYVWHLTTWPHRGRILISPDSKIKTTFLLVPEDVAIHVWDLGKGKSENLWERVGENYTRNNPKGLESRTTKSLKSKTWARTWEEWYPKGHYPFHCLHEMCRRSWQTFQAPTLRTHWTSKKCSTRHNIVRTRFSHFHTASRFWRIAQGECS